MLSWLFFDNVNLQNSLLDNKMKIQKFILHVALSLGLFIATSSQALAQNVEQIRWKSTAQVRAILGEPENVSSPVGTHASYVLWSYQDFTVAFSNGKAFHLFTKDSLKKISVNENRG